MLSSPIMLPCLRSLHTASPTQHFPQLQIIPRTMLVLHHLLEPDFFSIQLRMLDCIEIRNVW